MAYTFTVQEQAQIRVVYETAEAGQTPWWALYEKVSSLLHAALERGAVAGADIRETEAASLWFDGAVQVRSKRGRSDLFRPTTSLIKNKSLRPL